VKKSHFHLFIFKDLDIFRISARFKPTVPTKFRFMTVFKPVNLCLDKMYKLNSKHIKTWTKKKLTQSRNKTCKKSLKNCDHEWRQQFFRLWKFASFSTHLFGICPPLPLFITQNGNRWLKTEKKTIKNWLRTYFIKFLVKFTQNLQKLFRKLHFKLMTNFIFFTFFFHPSTFLFSAKKNIKTFLNTPPIPLHSSLRVQIHLWKIQMKNTNEKFIILTSSSTVLKNIYKTTKKFGKNFSNFFKRGFFKSLHL